MGVELVLNNYNSYSKIWFLIIPEVMLLV